MGIVGQRLTVEEFLKLPEEKPYLELWDGVVVQKACPGAHHSVLQTELLLRVNEFAEPNRLALALPELEAVYGGSVLTPDVAVYRWGRIPRDARGYITDENPGPPDIAAEVTSPDQAANALIRRCLWYVEHGVQIALLVDPKDESVILFRLEAQPRALRAAERIDLDEVLPGFELTPRELFASLRRR